MEGKQGTMDGEIRTKRKVERSHEAVRSRLRPAGAHPIATSAEVLTEASDPRLAKTGVIGIPA
jgi:hypothetical protein